MKVCTAKESRQPPPPPPGQTCTQTNVQQDGNKVTWTVACTGEMDMTGEGEVTYESDDSFTGKILFNAEGMTMTVNLTGKKIDECDKPIG